MNWINRLKADIVRVFRSIYDQVMLILNRLRGLRTPTPAERFKKDAEYVVRHLWKNVLHMPDDWRYTVATADALDDPGHGATVSLDQVNMVAMFRLSRLNIRTAQNLWEAVIHEMIHILHHDFLAAASLLPDDPVSAAIMRGEERTTLRVTRALLRALKVPRRIRGREYATDGEAAPWMAAVGL